MPKLRQNVIYHPSKGVVKLGRIGDDIPRGAVSNPSVFEDETAPEPEQPTRPIDGLDGLKVGELRELADERGIDLTGASQKGEIIDRIREADLV